MRTKVWIIGLVLALSMLVWGVASACDAYIPEGGITAECTPEGGVAGEVTVCSEFDSTQHTEFDLVLKEHHPGSPLWTPTGDVYHISTDVPSNDCITVPFTMNDSSTEGANSVRVENTLGNEKSESFGPCPPPPPPPPEMNWAADCEEGDLVVDNPDNLGGTISYTWVVTSALGTSNFPGSCELPGCSGSTTPWSAVGKTDISVSWTTTWDEGGSRQWQLTCGEMPSLSASGNCNGYGVTITPGSWPVRVEATVNFTVTHQMGDFSKEVIVGVDPGGAVGASATWDETPYGTTTVEWTATTSWGEFIEGSWEGDCVSPPPASCNEPPGPSGCKKGLVPFRRPDGKVVCRNFYCLTSSTCICQDAECRGSCDPEGILRTCSGELVCIETNPGGGFIPILKGICVHPLYPEALDCLPPEEPPGFVPEPGTIMLLGTGLAGLGGYASIRRRKK